MAILRPKVFTGGMLCNWWAFPLLHPFLQPSDWAVSTASVFRCCRSIGYCIVVDDLRFWYLWNLTADGLSNWLTSTLSSNGHGLSGWQLVLWHPGTSSFGCWWSWAVYPKLLFSTPRSVAEILVSPFTSAAMMFSAVVNLLAPRMTLINTRSSVLKPLSGSSFCSLKFYSRCTLDCWGL